MSDEPARVDVRQMAVLCAAGNGGPAFWSLKTGDLISTVCGPGYFNPFAADLRPCDKIDVVSVGYKYPRGFSLVVTEADRDAGTVAVQDWSR